MMMMPYPQQPMANAGNDDGTVPFEPETTTSSDNELAPNAENGGEEVLVSENRDLLPLGNGLEEEVKVVAQIPEIQEEVRDIFIALQVRL